jgi:hypothetical protein
MYFSMSDLITLVILPNKVRLACGLSNRDGRRVVSTHRIAPHPLG